MNIARARPLVLGLVLAGTLAWPVTAAIPARPALRPAAPNAFSDWPTYHRDAVRTGYDPTTPPIGNLARAWRTTLDGAVYAEPLMVGGRVIAATENDTVYALNPTTGAVLWRRNVGTPIPRRLLPCGNIDPLGITGTPVYDSSSGRLFVAAERFNRFGGIQHRIFALDPATGRVVGSRIIDPPGSNPRVQQQRAALAAGSGRVYVAFGGLAGDCGPYHGYVVGLPTNLIGSLLVYSALRYHPGAIRGGIWAPAGPTVNPFGRVLVAVGNGTISGGYDLSDSVLKLSASLRLMDWFAPSTWRDDNRRDADLGSAGPTLLGGYVFADGKSGTGFLLNSLHFGHIGGQIAMAPVCRSFGGTALQGSRIFVPCADGIRAVDVANGSFHVRWHASTNATGPPVVGGGAVWSLGIQDGVLYAIDPDTGATIASLPVGPVHHFATPALSGGLAFVPIASGVLAVSGA